MSKIKLIYLMGAGRSGTTALATFLGANKEIQVVGEMHQFFEYIMNAATCSCGEKLADCRFWGKVINKLPERTMVEVSELKNMANSVEAHTNIIHHLINKEKFTKSDEYLSIMEKIFEACKEVSNKTVLLDSAKYISRALALRNLTLIDLKVIYMVRDIRGVTHSFSKKVQSSRGTLSSILYYITINIAAEVACMIGLKNNVIKVRYEDMMNCPAQFFCELEDFLGIDLQETLAKIEGEEEFEIGHLIGGNRLKERDSIKFKADTRWSKTQSKMEQVLIYVAAFPLMLINRYSIFNKDK